MKWSGGRYLSPPGRGRTRSVRVRGLSIHEERSLETDNDRTMLSVESIVSSTALDVLVHVDIREADDEEAAVFKIACPHLVASDFFRLAVCRTVDLDDQLAL